MADSSGETSHFAACAVHRRERHTGVNLDISNLYRWTPDGIRMITRD